MVVFVEEVTKLQSCLQGMTLLQMKKSIYRKSLSDANWINITIYRGDNLIKMNLVLYKLN